MSFFIKKLAVIGVGLLGGSLARALRERDLVGEVVGVNRSRTALEKALALGVIDQGTTDVAEAVRQATLVLVATPVRAIVLWSNIWLPFSPPARWSPMWAASSNRWCAVARRPCRPWMMSKPRSAV